MNVRGTISVKGLYDYDTTLFDGIKIPAALDAETLISEILCECAQLETLYPDWSFLHSAIIRWSETRIHAWERMYSALSEEYNPLHNYDRHEDVEESSNISGNTINTVNGFNDFAQHDKADVASAGNSKRRAHLYGNVGTTKSQEMITDELNVRKTDMYKIIVDEFKTRFCILLY